MVHRALLTPRLVREADLQKDGEHWIADTKVKGFGLRIWSTKSGRRKAFALRVSEPKGKSTLEAEDTATPLG